MSARSLATLAPALFWCGAAGAADGEVRINQIQVVGSHNSYHIAPAPVVMSLIAATGRGHAEALDYTHPPLAEQFGRQGVRQIELDVFADPRGGHYAEPSARAMLRRAGKDPGPDPNAGGVLSKPGPKVLHVPDVDYRSTAPTFADALAQVRDWSAAHPRHVPILVLVELKDRWASTLPTRPLPFTAAELDGLDAAIRAAFGPGGTLTPDDVRGDSDTLPEALKARGWPTLESARGKVMFALDNEDAIRDRYLDGHPALRGRSLFVSVPPGHPAAAWMKVNDALKDGGRIAQFVRDGYLVRTRADIDTKEARANDPTRRDAALASGAQFVSTDFAAPRPDLSAYCVRFPGAAVARPNPVSGGPSRDATDLEGPLSAGATKAE